MGSKYKIGELCSFFRGASVPRARMRELDDYLYVHYGDLYKGFNIYIDVEDPQKPLPAIASSENIKDEQFLANQDIVYVLTSETVDDLGHAFLFKDPKNVPAVAGTETTIMRVNRQDLALPGYLNYMTQTVRFKRLLRQYIKGMKVFRVHPTDVARIEVELPSLEDQCKTVHILDNIESKIVLNQRANDYLGELLLAKYDQLFDAFNQNDCDGMLSDIGEIVGGATPSKKNETYYSHNGTGWITPRDLSNTDDLFIDHGADDITQAGYDACSAKLMPAGSVLFSSRAPIGYIAIASGEVATNQGFKSVVPKPEIGTAFVYCFLERNKQRIADMGAGTTFPEVSGKTMKNVKLKLPSLDDCTELSEFATPLLNMRQCNEKENRELAALRDALLPKLMSGEIDVSKIDITQLNNHLAVS